VKLRCTKTSDGFRVLTASEILAVSGGHGVGGPGVIITGISGGHGVGGPGSTSPGITGGPGGSGGSGGTGRG
jgi:hypothetical protein